MSDGSKPGAVADVVSPDVSVRSLMKWPVGMVETTATVRECAESLVDDELGALAVVDNDVLLGVVAERDVVRQVAADADLEETEARDFMSFDPVTTTPDATAGEALALMRDAAVRHLPVLDEGELVGFVSIRDLVARP
jgi:CBS domain-containing protein